MYRDKLLKDYGLEALVAAKKTKKEQEPKTEVQEEIQVNEKRKAAIAASGTKKKQRRKQPIQMMRQLHLLHHQLRKQQLHHQLRKQQEQHRKSSRWQHLVYLRQAA